VGQAKIFVAKLVNISHELCLRRQRVKHLLVHEGAFTFQIVGNPVEIFVVKGGFQKGHVVVIRLTTIFLNGKYFDNFGHVRDLSGLIHANSNQVFVNFSQIDPKFVEKSDKLVN